MKKKKNAFHFWNRTFELMKYMLTHEYMLLDYVDRNFYTTFVSLNEISSYLTSHTYVDMHRYYTHKSLKGL